MKKRLFLGIPLPASLHPLIDELRERYRDLSDIRWIPDQNIHLTVCFLGDIDEEKIPELIFQLKEVMKGQHPFSLSWDRFFLAPTLRHPSMIWVRFSEEKDWYEFIATVQKAVRRFMDREPEERKQIPHATVARFKNPFLGKKIQWSEVVIPKEPWIITDCMLYESQLSSEGSKYTVVETFPFGKTR